MSIKYKIIIFAFTILLAFLSYKLLLSSYVQAPQDIKVVEVEKITLKDISQSVQLIGTIRSKNSSLLTAQSEGTFKIIALAGKKLLKGEIIAKIDNQEVEQSYNLNLDAKTIAEEQYERAKALLKTKTYSKNEFEELKNKWIIAQKNLADAKIALNKLTFFAPFNGILGNYKVKEGQQLKAGDQIASFVDPDALTVDFDIPISILPNIHDGQNLSILEKDYKLKYVQKMLDDDKHMSPASVDIDCTNCIIGANVTVNLNVIDKKQVIVIPFDAVFLKNGKTFVYTIENNQTNLKPVTLGIRNQELVEVITGLNVGEEVVTHGTSRLWPGLEVKIHEEHATN